MPHVRVSGYIPPSTPRPGRRVHDQHRFSADGGCCVKSKEACGLHQRATDKQMTVTLDDEAADLCRANADWQGARRLLHRARRDAGAGSRYNHFRLGLPMYVSNVLNCRARSLSRFFLLV